MPYRLQGKTVQVKLPSGWSDLKAHSSLENARKHLSALKLQVKHPSSWKRK